MSELTEQLQSPAGNRYKELWDTVSYYKKQSNNSELLSVENVTSLILGRQIFYNNDMHLHYRILKNQIIHWLYEKIDTAAHNVDNDKIQGVIDFIKGCAIGDRNGRKSLVMTFNYDLLLERLFNQYIASPALNMNYVVKLRRYFDTDFGENNMSKELQGTFQYLKLHGSFNWFRSPGSQNTNFDNVFLVTDSDQSRDLIHYDDTPVFIPMAYVKGIFLSGSFYNILWNIAWRYLETADEIIFLGYGFPATDLDNMVCFLQFKDKIKHIVIKENNDKIQRLNNIFGSEKIINMDAYDYIVNMI
ncbi:MAG: SIR2 family protein [Spirochaetia bacterium]|nr:SIR2 family protein [Spirochaetia bacterium]